MPSAAQLAAYSALLHQAKAFVKQRRRDIQQRQEAVMAAQADWRAVLGALEEQQAQLQAGSAGGEGAAAGGGGVPPELAQAVQQLRQLKGVLQDQIHALNEETQQIKGLKARVRRRVLGWGWLSGNGRVCGSGRLHTNTRRSPSHCPTHPPPCCCLSATGAPAEGEC